MTIIFDELTMPLSWIGVPPWILATLHELNCLLMHEVQFMSRKAQFMKFLIFNSCRQAIHWFHLWWNHYTTDKRINQASVLIPRQKKALYKLKLLLFRRALHNDQRRPRQATRFLPTGYIFCVRPHCKQGACRQCNNRIFRCWWHTRSRVCLKEPCIFLPWAPSCCLCQIRSCVPKCT